MHIRIRQNPKEDESSQKEATLHQMISFALLTVGKGTTRQELISSAVYPCKICKAANNAQDVALFHVQLFCLAEDVVAALAVFLASRFSILFFA